MGYSPRTHVEMLAFSSLVVLHSVLTGVPPWWGLRACEWYLGVMDCEIPEPVKAERRSGLDGWKIDFQLDEGPMSYKATPLFNGDTKDGFAPEKEYVEFAEILSEYIGDLIDDDRLLQPFSCIHLSMIAYYLESCIIQLTVGEKVDLVGLGQVANQKMIAYGADLGDIWDNRDLLVCEKTFRRRIKQLTKTLDVAKQICRIPVNLPSKN